MTTPKAAQLKSRSIIDVKGEDAARFLDGLLTCPVQEGMKPAYGALLTPQGKIVADLFVYWAEKQHFFIDIASSMVDAFLKKLTLYKLRAKVKFENTKDRFAVLAIWDEAADFTLLSDPRRAGLGHRGVVQSEDILSTYIMGQEEKDYHTHRIRLGVPEGGIDYPFGEVFPHDVGLDSLNGVSFTKGCFVGQEVVSRMKHRGTARKRPVRLHSSAKNALKFGETLYADGTPCGTVGSSIENEDMTIGIAIARLDRLRHAMHDGKPITVGKGRVSVSLPYWASYEWPDLSQSAGDE
jgi:hypothetical protein